MTQTSPTSTPPSSSGPADAARSGIDLDALADTGRWLAGLLGRETGSKAGKALATR